MEINFEAARRILENQKVKYWDIRTENTNTLTVFAWNKKIKRISENLSSGFCVRVLSKNGWGFSSCDDKSKLKETIQKSIRAAKLMDKESEKTSIFESPQIKDKKSLKLKNDPRDVSLKEKKEIILKLAKKAHDYNKKIKSVMVWSTEDFRKKIFFNENCLIEQNPLNMHIGSNITASEGEKIEEQFFGKSNLLDYNFIEKSEKEILEKCKKSLIFLKAKKAKSGAFDIITDEALTGVFMHEAVGHASEADLILMGESCLEGLIGKKIAPSYVSLIDDPTENNYSSGGSFFYDEEGTKTQKTYIIKNGVLNTYLHSRETASKLKAKPTGNARAQSFMNMPIVRMSNTYLEKGDNSFEEMLSKIKNGYYLKGSKGGEVNPAKGSFQFAAAEAYLVKNGKIIKPVRAVSMGGDTLKILKNIKETENKSRGSFPGFCGKHGQNVPVEGDNPHTLIKKVLLS